MTPHLNLLQVPLRYLLSVFFVDLKSLWEPATQCIATHARKMKSSDFWKVFGDHLELLATQAGS